MPASGARKAPSDRGEHFFQAMSQVSFCKTAAAYSLESPCWLKTRLPGIVGSLSVLVCGVSTCRARSPILEIHRPLLLLLSHSFQYSCLHPYKEQVRRENLYAVRTVFGAF